MTTQLKPLLAPVLDPRTEKTLVDYALDRIFVESNGRLNEFSAGSPARVLIEGQAFAGAELLYYVNQLPEAFAIAFLQIAGIQQIVGSPATAALTFTLSAPLGNVFTIPAGYIVKAKSGAVSFATDAALTIPPGIISGSITATATEVGTQGNVGANALTELTQPLAFLQSVTNLQPATPGNDGESLDETKTRAFAAIRRRGLVSADDYRQEAIAFLGFGSSAKAIGNLGPDKVSKVVGAVHVFALNPAREALTSAQANSLQAELQRKSHVSAIVFVSSVDLHEIDVSIIARLLPGSNPDPVGTAIYNAVSGYLKAGDLPLGELILLSEIFFKARVEGTEHVFSVVIGPANGTLLAQNYVLPNTYSAASLSSLRVELTRGTESYVYQFGIGDPD